MSRPQLVATAALAIMACLSLPTPAHADGTWPASVQLSTVTASQGDQISFSGQGPDGVDSGSCTVAFDGALLTGATCSWDKSGAIFGSFEVPTDAATGVSATVSVCWPGCYDDALDDVSPDYWQANTDLGIVTAPFVKVPDVTCLPVKDAAAHLEQEGFEVLIDSGGDVVTEQEPRPGERIQQTVPVVLLFPPVLVPKVVGNTYGGARAALAEACLAISAVDRITDGIVTLQDPLAGARVAGGTFVSVTMSGRSTFTPPTTAPTTPPTPPATTPPTAPATTSPTPPATTPPIPPTAPPTTAAPESDPVAFPRAATPQALAALAALLLVGSLLARAVQRHQQRRWIAKHVTVSLRPGHGTPLDIQPQDEGETDHVITVVPREIGRSMTVTEDPS